MLKPCVGNYQTMLLFCFLEFTPCHVADNVGDNVGDIAGMGADLFGSFAESTCAALVISSVSSLGVDHLYTAMFFPLMISATGLIVCLLTTIVATDLRPARVVSEIENTLKLQLIISTVLATPVCLGPIACPFARSLAGRPRYSASQAHNWSECLLSLSDRLSSQCVIHIDGGGGLHFSSAPLSE